MTMSLLYVMTPAGRIAEAVGLQKTVRNATHLAVPVLFGSGPTMLGMAPTVLMVPIPVVRSMGDPLL